jgi:hypothetical protein
MDYDAAMEMEEDAGGDMGYSTVRNEALDAPMEPEPVAAMDDAPAPKARGRFKNRNKAKRSERRAPAKPGVTAAEAPPETGASGGEAEAPEESSPESEEARHIVYTAGMRIAVFNLEEALLTAEAIPERYGGYVQTMSDSQVVLRIPSKHLRTVMSSFAGYGNVEQRWLRSQDVTAEFTDLSSRLKALEKTHEQLLELLGKARTVEEALKVREALDRVASELEVIKGRLRQLENMTAYSTLTLDFYERGPHTPVPSSNDPFPWVDSLGVENTEWK